MFQMCKGYRLIQGTVSHITHLLFHSALVLQAIHMRLVVHEEL